MSSLLVVHNPASGRGRAAALAEELVRLLEARGVPCELRATRASGSVFREVDPARHTGVVVVGGDGTLHAAVDELPRPLPPVGFLGSGTVNVAALEAGLPRTPAGLAELVAARRTARFRPLRAGATRALLFVEAGFLGRVVARVNELRQGSPRHGKVEFVRAFLGVLPTAWGRPLRVRLRTEEGTWVERACSNVLATRVRAYAGTMPMPLAPVDGAADERRLSEAFDVVCYRSRTPLGHLLLLGLAAARLLPRLRGVLHRLGWMESYRVLELEVEGPEGEGVHVDAETSLPSGELRLPLRVVAASDTYELFAPG